MKTPKPKKKTGAEKWKIFKEIVELGLLIGKFVLSIIQSQSHG